MAEERPHDWLDKVKVTPIDEDAEIGLAVQGPLEIAMPATRTYKMKLEGWQQIAPNMVRHYEVEVFLSSPMTVTIERLNNPFAGDN